MFKFLFGKKPEEAVVKETQRETVARALGEVNEILGVMAVKAKIAVNLETGLLEIDLPEQMPDEALALPAPAEKAKEKAEEKAEATKPEPEEKPAADATPEADTPAKDAPKAEKEAA